MNNRNNILIKTNIPMSEIYDKTLENIDKLDKSENIDKRNKKIKNIVNCNIDNLILLNAIYLSLNELFPELQIKIYEEERKLQKGGSKNIKAKTKKMRKNKRKLENRRHVKNQKRKHTHKKKKQTIKNNIKNMTGGKIMKMIISWMICIFTILTITQYVSSVQPEYDVDVISRLIQVEKIKDLFENNYGTCAANSALFLGSINLDTYEMITEKIIKEGHGPSFSESTNYFNSSLATLWNWEWFTIPRIEPEKHQLRGTMEIEMQNIKYEEVNAYINLLKEKMMNIKSEKTDLPEQGILTALGYPSSRSAHHSVVAWLTSDNTLVIIDPQEFFVTGSVILYSDNLSKYPEFESKSIQNYFMKNLDYTIYNTSILLKDFHIKREENLMELTENNEKVTNIVKKLRGIGVRDL